MDSIRELYNLYLPIAETNINGLILITIGLFVGLIAGMCGIGGGIISIPILMSLGIPTNIAVATSTNQIIAASFSSCLAYARKGRVDYKLGALILIGSMLGVIIGINLFYWISSIGKIEVFVNVSFMLILSSVATLSARDAAIIIYYKYKKLIIPHKPIPSLVQNMQLCQVHLLSVKNKISIVFPIIIGFIGGLMLALLGIGGSIIIAPIMLYIGISSAYTPGTVHFQMIFISILSCIIHAVTSYSVDIVLSVALIVGTVFGAQLGAKIGSKFSQETFKIVLATVVLVLCVKVSVDLFATPKNLYFIERVSK